MEFLVRWEGTDPSEDTWEPLANVRHNIIFQAYIHEHNIDIHKKRPPAEQRDGPYVRLNGKVADRFHRAQTERLYLLSQKDATTQRSGMARSYAVLGSTGNVYHVKICKNPTCTCPDCAKGHVCKHIMLVMLNVLKVETQSLAYQKCLLQSELSAIFAHAPLLPSSSVTAPQVVVNAYEDATGTSKKARTDDAKEAAEDDKEEEEVEVECPICFEPAVRAKEPLARCGTCRKSLHEDCIERWLEHGKNCPLCRGPWCVVSSHLGVVVSGKKRGRGDPESGYLNISTGDEQPTRYEYDYW